ncbi:hypothetical protein BOSE21B_50363 [Bosea sp. 21B]|nr:hypothetical protein BOSE21B_50363 [Bosea sp. 21B]
MISKFALGRYQVRSELRNQRTTLEIKELLVSLMILKFAPHLISGSGEFQNRDTSKSRARPRGRRPPPS